MTNHHDARDCDCTPYRPDFSIGELRLTGDNFFCSKRGRYVSNLKWKGGIVKFNNRSRLVPFFQCPCCGVRMRFGRRNKARIEKSIKHQTEHPEEYSSYILSKLELKQKLLRENKLIPRVA